MTKLGSMLLKESIGIGSWVLLVPEAVCDETSYELSDLGKQVKSGRIG